MRRRTFVNRFFLGMVGTVLGATITWAVIELVVSYVIPGSLLVALGLVAALVGGGTTGLWLKLPHLRPLAVGLPLGALAYVVVVAAIVITSVRAFERMG